MTKRQLRLFETAPVTMAARVRAVVPDDALIATAQRLPPTLRLGATGWTTPRWDGWVWEQARSSGVLAREGIGPYAKHPLLRTVFVDGALGLARDSDALARLASATPETFRFVVGADPALLWGRIPNRGGEGAPADNPLFFDPAAMVQRCVAPFIDGLGERGGVLLLRVPSQDARALGSRRTFPQRLHRLLRALPAGPRYAVELRDHKLLSTEYADVLADCNAIHCMSLHPSMPSLEKQAEVTRPLEANTVVAVWSMCLHFDYRVARGNYAPYNAIVDRDTGARAALVSLLRQANELRKDAFVLVDNMAEGCAPASIAELAETLAN